MTPTATAPGEPAAERPEFLSTGRAGRRAVRFAARAVLLSAVLFCAAVPFATLPLTHVSAFIPAYESALVICDLITAVLLFGQFKFLRSRATLVLANGYLFTAFIAFAHALTFPGVFAPSGLLGAGAQSTAWLYMFWHGGFPLFVIAYALLKGEERGEGSVAAEAGAPGAGAVQTSILGGIAAVLAAVCLLTLAATAGEDFLPVLILNNRFTVALTAVVTGIWLLSLLALGVLWRRRPHTVLDLWLMVVMCAWLFDIALSAVLNASRFDLGWYAGRLYGLLAASFVLIVLLYENSRHYASLARLTAELRTANTTLRRLSLQDDLTDIPNRRFFDTYLAAQIALARRNRRPLALVMCDVDAFKAYNDHYGHQAGDECLKRVAAALRSCCRRPADMVARYGGEEFALILPDTDLTGAAQIAAAARNAVARSSILHGHSAVARVVTISGGVAVMHGSTPCSAQQLIAAADLTMYQAKDQGRNRIVCVPAEAA